MRKKSVLGALIGALALAVAAVALASPQLQQTADIKLTGTKKTGKPAGVKATLTTNDPGATPAGNFPAATKVVIKLPEGTKANSNAKPQCNLSETEISNNLCPANTVIGGGSALANVVFSPTFPVIQGVPADVTIYNRKNAIALRVVSEQQGNLPPQTIPIIGKLTKSGILTVPVPVLHPAGPTSKVVLTSFSVNIKSFSKTKGKGKRKKTIHLLRTPKKCNKGTWTTTADFTYDDGTTKKGIKTTQKCRKPRKKKN